MESSFADLAQRDATEWAGRLEQALDSVEELLQEGQIIAGAVDIKLGVPSPLGLAPSYPGLSGPVIAVLRAADLRAAIARWKSLKERI